MNRYTDGRGQLVAGGGTMIIRNNLIYMSVGAGVANMYLHGTGRDTLLRQGSFYTSSNALEWYGNDSDPYVMYMAYGGDGRKMALMPYGLSFTQSGYGNYELAFLNGNLSYSGQLSGNTVTRAAYFIVGSQAQGYGVFNGGGGNVTANVSGAASAIIESYTATSPNVSQLRGQFYRFQNGSSWPGVVYRQLYSVDNVNFVGGYMDLGATSAGIAFWSFGRGGGTQNGDIYYSGGNGRIETSVPFYAASLAVGGAKQFVIPHPDPSKPAGTELRHSTVESPTAGDTLYRFAVTITATQVNQLVYFDLPDYFPFLNTNPQIWINQLEDGTLTFAQRKAKIMPDKTRFAVRANAAAKFNVLILGTRQDKLGVESWLASGGVDGPRLRDTDPTPTWTYEPPPPFEIDRTPPLPDPNPRPPIPPIDLPTPGSTDHPSPFVPILPEAVATNSGVV
jgi:hypothetical protein